MTGEYFEKVMITSEADLPTDDEEYVCHQRRLDNVTFVRGNYLRKYWKLAFDWYLRPTIERDQSNDLEPMIRFFRD